MFSENLFLTNETGKHLYNAYAKDLPIIDYHCHLLPQDICENKVFEDLGEMWLAGDHYKWRAMRTFGIDERLITGDASYYEKYLAFAQIMPQLIGNPLYIWCALELKRYFDIDEPLGPENAEAIYQQTKAMIVEKQMTPRWCMEVSKVEVASTTEDPVDSLEYHKKMLADPDLKVRVLSAFRPDKVFYCEKADFPGYLPQLEGVTGMAISSFASMMAALEKRLLDFKGIGTMISDNGIADFTWADFTEEQVEAVYAKAAKGETLTTEEINQYKSACLAAMGQMYHRQGFVMQLHIGTYQGANKVMEKKVGISTGFDCTDDTTSVRSVGALLNYLNEREALPKTILYPLNPVLMEPFAILAAGFCEGGTRAKVQLGAPWWFNDQVYGIQRQFEAVANLYPISLSVGMLTDSRSFLSYPRHELYRRMLCSYLGTLVERGEYFSGEAALKQVVENVCYHNAREFFGLA